MLCPPHYGGFAQARLKARPISWIELRLDDKPLIRLRRFPRGAECPLTKKVLWPYTCPFNHQAQQLEGRLVAKPNYQYEKRQKDLAKKKKKEEKRLRKLEKNAPATAEDNPDQGAAPVAAPDQGEAV